MESRAVLRKLKSQLHLVSALDAAWCLKRFHVIQGRLKKGQPVDRLLGQLLTRFDQSRSGVRQRTAALPSPEYDDALPISAHRNEILEAIRKHQVIIVAGETGSGKTTQLPKLCLEAGRGARGLIACTQPRRIAARAMAERVAEELNSTLGGIVGYQVRFRDRSSPDGYIKFMTDGILLSESLNDRYLNAYDTIIIDEAHERSLNIDFLLGYLRQLLPRRPDLRLIITSATIDTEKFSRHFNKAPVIEVSGRSYPVDLIYQELSGDGDRPERSDRDLYLGIADAVRRLNRIDPMGDILVFLSGEREIREAGDFLKRQNLGKSASSTEILPLYARLSSAEQRRVFHPGGQRRIILATNVAETSLTVPRIRFVIDSGTARISRYGHRSRIQRLPIEPVSQASANQRAGRCGRLSPGTCVRLYTEEDFESRPEYTEPEILRTSLASVILRMMTMGLGSVEEFPFVDKPAPRMINDAYQLLFELAAIDEARSVTALGKKLARWPMDVRLARMVEEGARNGCLEDLIVLAAALSIQDPRERPLDAQAAADDAHRRFANDKSDFLTLLELWKYLRSLRKSISGNQFRKRCRQEFLNWQRVLEWFDLYQQLRDQARESRLRLTGHHGDYDQVHKSILAGLLSHCGLRNPEDHGYTGVRSRSFLVFPGSGLFGGSPKWLMAAEIVETTRPYARINAVIQPEWIESVGSHLLKRRHFDPHWSRRRAAVLAWEQVTLHGLVIVEKRRIQFAALDQAESRRIFILEALVRGEWDIRAPFVDHNQTIRAEVEALEHKRRKRDVLADEHSQFEFFDARIPAHVNSGKTFEKWLSGLADHQRKQLYLGHEVLMKEDAGQAPAELFPDYLESAGKQFSLTYHFDPGHPEDGVSISVPLEFLNMLDPGRMQWLVPGLLRDKLVALIRQLPKPLRRSLTPVPAFADALLEAIRGREGEQLLDTCARELSRLTGMEVSAADLDEESIPDHFRFFVRVVDAGGEVLECGRDLAAIQARLGARARRQFMAGQGARFTQDDETDWAFGELKTTLLMAGGATAWPALVDQGSSVGMRLFDTWDEAAQSHAEGVVRLVSIRLSDKLKYLARNHDISREALLAWSSIDSAERLVADLIHRSLVDCAGDVSNIRNPESFEALCQSVRAGIGDVLLARAALLDEFLQIYGRLAPRINQGMESTLSDVFNDIATQLEDLVYPGFLTELESGRLQHYPRYIRAIEERMAQLDLNPARDHQRMAQVETWWNRYLGALEAGRPYDENLDSFRWLLEEYRVSLFAQRLGTATKVSEKRLAEAWEKTGC